MPKNVTGEIEGQSKGEKMSKEGWTWLYNATKWHYFVDGRSLCGKYMLFGQGNDLEQGHNNSPDNCVSCKRKLKIRLETEKK